MCVLLVVRYALFFVLAVLLLAACAPAGPPPAGQPLPVATLMPTRPIELAPPASAPAPATAEPADSGWLDAGPGVELRRLRVPAGAGLASISVVRLDPAQVRFQVGYAPDAPRSPSAWRRDTGALAVINGGFFDEAHRATALVISGGQAAGESYQGRGGMFAVDAGGAVSLRYLAEQPYDPAEPLAEALQGWPMLIRPGGALAYTGEDGDVARRSVVARDRAGRVLLIVCPTNTFTLRGLAEWLAASDLDLDAALNLDGGSSTGLVLAAGARRERVDAFVPLPLVLLVLPR